MALTNSSGTAVETYRYTAFGRMRVYEGDGETELTNGTAYGNPYGYTGRHWDHADGQSCELKKKRHPT